MLISSLDKPSYVSKNNEYTNLGFRIANLIHTMKGSSDYAMLAFYSNHMEQFLDEVIEKPTQEGEVLDYLTNEPVKEVYEHKYQDNRLLRGSLGPRLRNWIGSHQLQESIDINSELSDDMEFVKPEGIDQLKEAFEDLNAHELECTTVMVRDPAIDFDQSNNIPDLSLINFTIDTTRLITIMHYQSVTLKESNIVNEIWALQMIGLAFAAGLEKPSFNLQVSYTKYLDEYGGLEWLNQIFTEDSISYNPFSNNIDDFIHDINMLEKVEMAVRNIFKESSFNNSEIGIEYLSEVLEGSLFEHFKLAVCKDMAYCLLIFGLSKGGDEYRVYQLSTLEKITTSLLVKEAESFING